jgi:hypothetical protein
MGSSICGAPFFFRRRAIRKPARMLHAQSGETSDFPVVQVGTLKPEKRKKAHVRLLTGRGDHLETVRRAWGALRCV